MAAGRKTEKFDFKAFFTRRNHRETEPFARAGTSIMFRQLVKCNNDDEYRRLFDPERAAYDRTLDEDWKDEYVNNLKSRVTLSERRLSELTECSINTVRSWSKEAPKKRLHYIAIACVFGLGVDTCSRMMQRYGDYSGLSEKNIYDVPYIRLLQLSQRPLNDFENSEKQKVFFNLSYNYIFAVDKYVKRDGDIRDNGKKLLQELNDGNLIRMLNFAEYQIARSGMLLHDEIVKIIKKMGYNSKDAFFKSKNLKAMYPKALSNLSSSEGKQIPDRKVLISLFLHMGLPLATITRLLDMVHMEPLCPKDTFEGALIYALSSLYKTNSNFESEKLMISSSNEIIQKTLESGSVYNYVAKKFETEVFKERFKKYEVDIDDCLCKHLIAKGDDK